MFGGINYFILLKNVTDINLQQIILLKRDILIYCLIILY